VPKVVQKLPTFVLDGQLNGLYKPLTTETPSLIEINERQACQLWDPEN